MFFHIIVKGPWHLTPTTVQGLVLIYVRGVEIKMAVLLLMNARLEMQLPDLSVLSHPPLPYYMAYLLLGSAEVLDPSGPLSAAGSRRRERG